MKLLWISLAMIMTAIVFIAVFGDSKQVLPITHEQLSRLTFYAIAASAICYRLLSSSFSLSNAVKNAAIWIIAFAILILGYNNRYHLQDIAHNISSGLIPQSIMSADLSNRHRIAIDRSDNGHYNIKATINEHNAYFLIDTVATSIVLTYETAIDIGINANDLAYTTLISTANGQLKTAKIRLDSISIGPIKRQNLRALIAPSGSLSSNLLGMNFINSLSSTSILGSQLILID